MSSQDDDQYRFGDSDELAAVENVTQMCRALLDRHGLGGQGWQALREDLYRFCLTEIAQGGPNGPYTLSEIESKVRAFHAGYMACHHYWQRELGKYTSVLKEKYRLT